MTQIGRCRFCHKNFEIINSKTRCNDCKRKYPTKFSETCKQIMEMFGEGSYFDKY